MKILRTYPAKLGLLFLVLVAVGGVASVLVALRVFDRRQVEIDQRLNRDIAASMASEIEPLLLSAAEDGRIGSAMHYMMVMNPAVEIYLLDGSGSILDYFAAEGPPVQVERVDVAPIEGFLSGDAPLPILGDNPRRPEARHHFSAAPISLGADESGYLYVILRSSEYDAATMGLQRRYLLRALTTSSLITIPIVGMLGLVVFFFMTRPLKRLTRTVRTFGSGEYTARSSIRSHDEIGDLAENFNWMADTIVGNMKRLAHADRERRELIANISHDLRNPLATIQGYLETLSQKDPTLGVAERGRYYDILLSTAKALPRLVDDLFELSKLEAPDAKPSMERFSLSELVQDVVMQWKSRAADRGVDLSTKRPDDLYLVYGNVGLIERALMNLVRNAIAHTPEGGAVVVSLAGKPGEVRVEVADTGVGISAKDRERVFDRFYIADASRSKSRDGSGLGLAICKRIVELHGGAIGVDSEEGVGSTFHFELPLCGPSEPDT